MVKMKKHNATPENLRGGLPRERPQAYETSNPGRGPSPTLSCDEAIDLMGMYLARELTGDRMERFVTHLRGCEVCHDKLLSLELHLHLNGGPRPPVPN